MFLMLFPTPAFMLAARLGHWAATQVSELNPMKTNLKTNKRKQQRFICSEIFISASMAIGTQAA